MAKSKSSSKKKSVKLSGVSHQQLQSIYSGDLPPKRRPAAKFAAEAKADSNSND